MKRRRPVDIRNATMIEVAYARTGSMLRAARVVAFIQAWAVVRDELGRQPSVDEYADHWREPRSSAYRQLALFREVFDRAEWPDEVLAVVEAHHEPSGPFDFGGLVAA